MGECFTQAEYYKAEFSSATPDSLHQCPVPALGQLWSFSGPTGRAVVAVGLSSIPWDYVGVRLWVLLGLTSHWSHPFSPHEPAGRGQLKRCADIKGNKVEKNMERKETCILQLGREDWGAHLSTASENASFPGTFLFRRCRLPHPTSSHILHSSFPPLPILTGPIPKRQILPSGYF